MCRNQYLSFPGKFPSREPRERDDPVSRGGLGIGTGWNPIALTPEHIHCGEDADSIDSDHGDLEVTPEIGDNYIGAKILIPCGGVLLRGRVTRRKRDANGNPIGRSHDSPALDMQS